MWLRQWGVLWWALAWAASVLLWGEQTVGRTLEERMLNSGWIGCFLQKAQQYARSSYLLYCFSGPLKNSCRRERVLELGRFTR